MEHQSFIDLRSDTVTLPTDEMLEAIRTANLGDDVYNEDPTVNKLEEMAAEKMGKQAAVLVASGTMANLVSLMSNTNRGESVLLEAESHIYHYEAGGISAIAGLLPLPIKGTRGALNPISIESKLKLKSHNLAETTLVCIENTHNRYSGAIITPSQIRELYDFTNKHELKLYMDGSRIFNAAVALKIDIKKFSRYVDNLMFCLSKGLSCPIGSIVLGDEEFIQKARKVRRMLGGGMRQSGIIAAPGIIALDKMVDRLQEDHENAFLLAKKLSKIEGIYLDPYSVETNIVIFDIRGLRANSKEFVECLRVNGVKALNLGGSKIRMVTHRGIEKGDIDRAIDSVVDTIRDLGTPSYERKEY